MAAIDNCLLTVREEVTTFLGPALGLWTLPNTQGTMPAIAITPDLETGEVYPPPGTDLEGGVEVIVRVSNGKMPFIDEGVWIEVEVVIATDNNVENTILAGLDALRSTGYFLTKWDRMSQSNPSKKVITLKTIREISSSFAHR